MTRQYRTAADVLTDVARTVVYLGVELNGVNDRGLFDSTPLDVAISWGDPIAVQLLLEAGAEVNVIIEHGFTPLHDAVSFGDVEIVRMLLDRGARTDVKNDIGQRPFDIAMLKQRPDLVDLLKSR